MLWMGCAEPRPEETQHAAAQEPVTIAQPSTPVSEASPVADTVQQKVYANQRFRNVRVHRMDDSTFLIAGEGQIFEASFGWTLEDGHNELRRGFATTDAGAPEWGAFSFKVHAQKARPGSTLHLILFEISAKDGSRQHKLPLFLY